MYMSGTNPSPTARRVLEFLADGMWHSEAEIVALTGTADLKRDLRLIKKNRFKILKQEGASETGRPVIEYRWDAADADRPLSKGGRHG